MWPDHRYSVRREHPTNSIQTIERVRWHVLRAFGRINRSGFDAVAQHLSQQNRCCCGRTLFISSPRQHNLLTGNFLCCPGIKKSIPNCSCSLRMTGSTVTQLHNRSTSVAVCAQSLQSQRCTQVSNTVFQTTGASPVGTETPDHAESECAHCNPPGPRCQQWAPPRLWCWAAAQHHKSLHALQLA